MRIQMRPGRHPDQLPTEHMGLYSSLSVFLLFEEGGPEGAYHFLRTADSL